MADQAQKLRDLVSVKRSRARVISFTSGKGGVGKTNLSVSLALALIALKKRVALVDFDLGLANTNVLLRCRHRWNLSHYLSGEKSLVDVLVMGPGGLLFLPGANGLSHLADLDDGKRQTLVQGLESLEKRVDYILVDTGAGISKNVLTFAAAADDVVVLTTPEPTAVLDAYSVVKNLSAFTERGNIHLIVNQVSHRKVAVDVADRFCQASEQFLDMDVQKMGYVLTDPQVGLSVLKRRPFILEAPRCPAAQCLETMARCLAKAPVQKVKTEGFFSRLMNQVFRKSFKRVG
jgi:flagellar biosynthesis protein FlhG